MYAKNLAASLFILVCENSKELRVVLPYFLHVLYVAYLKFLACCLMYRSLLTY